MLVISDVDVSVGFLLILFFLGGWVVTPPRCTVFLVLYGFQQKNVK